MSLVVHCRAATAILALLSVPSLALVQPEAAISNATDPTPSAIVIGFVGGFVGRDNLRHSPVQLAQRLRHSVGTDARVLVFENRHRKQARRAILALLDANHDGVLSEQEKNRARVILYGHSWGAAATVVLARELRQDGIPVLLTVQVDSVHKLWQNDTVIPDNVAEAVNFYQPHGWVHGRPQITAADPSKTQILGNYLSDYRKNPIACVGVSWYDRFFTPGHAQSECDPRVWSQVEDMVRQRLILPSVAGANPRPQTAGDNSKLSISLVSPTTAATATNAPPETAATGSRLSGSTISK